MAIKLGEQFIVDASKADTSLTYEWIPDIPVPHPTTGKYVSNTELGREEGIWIIKKHLTTEKRSQLLYKRNPESDTVSIPMTDIWKATVVTIHGLIDSEGKEVTPDGVLNAVGSSMADALVVASFHDTFYRSSLTEDERKN